MIVDLELVDYERMAELVDTYADFPLGTTDAAVVAVAESGSASPRPLRLTVVTFTRFDPGHADGFELLP